METVLSCGFSLLQYANCEWVYGKNNWTNKRRLSIDAVNPKQRSNKMIWKSIRHTNGSRDTRCAILLNNSRKKNQIRTQRSLFTWRSDLHMGKRQTLGVWSFNLCDWTWWYCKFQVQMDEGKKVNCHAIENTFSNFEVNWEAANGAAEPEKTNRERKIIQSQCGFLPLKTIESANRPKSRIIEMKSNAKCITITNNTHTHTMVPVTVCSFSKRIRSYGFVFNFQF